MAKRVKWAVYPPRDTKPEKLFDLRKDAQAYCDKKNKDVPSWYYEELWKVGWVVVETEEK